MSVVNDSLDIPAKDIVFGSIVYLLASLYKKVQNGFSWNFHGRWWLFFGDYDGGPWQRFTVRAL